MSDSVTRSWWARVAQLRNGMDQSTSFHEAQALAMERAVNEMYSEACSPWFDERAFVGAAS